jgi:hypothetical protein
MADEVKLSKGLSPGHAMTGDFAKWDYATLRGSNEVSMHFAVVGGNGVPVFKLFELAIRDLTPLPTALELL